MRALAYPLSVLSGVGGFAGQVSEVCLPSRRQCTERGALKVGGGQASSECRVMRSLGPLNVAPRCIAVCLLEGKAAVLMQSVPSEVDAENYFDNADVPASEKIAIVEQMTGHFRSMVEQQYVDSDKRAANQLVDTRNAKLWFIDFGLAEKLAVCDIPKLAGMISVMLIHLCHGFGKSSALAAPHPAMCLHALRSLDAHLEALQSSTKLRNPCFDVSNLTAGEW